MEKGRIKRRAESEQKMWQKEMKARRNKKNTTNTVVDRQRVELSCQIHLLFSKCSVGHDLIKAGND